MQKIIEASELIINPDGSIFHLNLRPGEVADTVLLVGDPGRVEQVARHFDECETERENREFRTVTGLYNGLRMTVCSTGIGTDNIDIVLTELDALVNIDFTTRRARKKHKQLTILRLGTCGALQPELEIGDFLFSETSIGFDNLLFFYADSERVRNLEMEARVMQTTGVRSYCVDASPELAELFKDVAKRGLTVSAPGFYGPQGRFLRMAPADPDLNKKLEDMGVTNFEMEGSAVAGLGRLLGHRCGTLCTVVAQRRRAVAAPDYHLYIERMIKVVLGKL